MEKIWYLFRLYISRCRRKSVISSIPKHIWATLGGRRSCDLVYLYRMDLLDYVPMFLCQRMDLYRLSVWSPLHTYFLCCWAVFCDFFNICFYKEYAYKRTFNYRKRPQYVRRVYRALLSWIALSSKVGYSIFFVQICTFILNWFLIPNRLQE